MTYIHGSSPREQQRLIDQAERFDGLLAAQATTSSERQQRLEPSMVVLT